MRWLQARRWFLARKGVAEPLQSLLSSPLPRASADFDTAEFVALDIETTGLNAATADMLSVGWVVVRRGRIATDSAETRVVRPSGEVGDSASVHGLTDTIVGAGHDWAVVLDEIVRVLSGRVLVVHHAGLDKALLDRMCRQRFGAKLLVPVVDTLALELRRRQRTHHVEPDTSLRLADRRGAYGLPRYAGHDCLVDAIAAAELLLAIVAHRGPTSVGDLLS